MRIFYIIICIIFMLECCAEVAKNKTSFFLQPTEAQQAENILACKASITIDAIIFFDEKNWIIWINGNIYSSDNSVKTSDFAINKVTNREVTLILPNGIEQILYIN